MKSFFSLKAVASVLLSAALVLQNVASVADRTDAAPSVVSTVSNPLIWSDVPDNDVIRVGDT